MEYKEIYCFDCKKILARYNVKFFSDDKIADLMKSNHVLHVKAGHEIEIRKIGKN